MHFALLNNDCLWVMDEVQLMGNGLATTAQACMVLVKSFGQGQCHATFCGCRLPSVKAFSTPAIGEIGKSYQGINWSCRREISKTLVFVNDCGRLNQFR